jgi:hypothetical protein
MEVPMIASAFARSNIRDYGSVRLQPDLRDKITVRLKADPTYEDNELTAA